MWTSLESKHTHSEMSNYSSGCSAVLSRKAADISSREQASPMLDPMVYCMKLTHRIYIKC